MRLVIHLHSHGPMPMGELARDLGIACSTATEHVVALEARGFARRRRSDTDRRQVLVEFTPEARAVSSEVHERRRLVLDEAMRKLSPRERAAFVKGLGLLAKTAEASMDRNVVATASETRSKELPRNAVLTTSTASPRPVPLARAWANPPKPSQVHPGRKPVNG